MCARCFATRDVSHGIVPDRTASVFLAEMIINEETQGTPAEALALLEAIPMGDGRNLLTPTIEGSVEFLLGMCHKKLAATPDDEHARRTFQHMQRATKIPSPHTYDAVCEFAALAAAADFPTHAAIMFLLGCNAGHARCTERVRELTAADPLNVHFVRGVWAARSNGLLTDDEASRNPTLVAAWALAEANPSEKSSDVRAGGRSGGGGGRLDLVSSKYNSTI